VAALHPTVTTGVVPVVVAVENTTRAVATARGSKWCHAVVEATILVMATLKAAAKVPAEISATWSGTAESPATKIGVAMLPGNKSCKGKS
jgi:hypothetical protein